MLSDPGGGDWPGAARLEPGAAQPPGVDAPPGAWEQASLAGRCALCWRAAVHLAARLRARFSADQLVTVRYEEMIGGPAVTARRLSAFLGAPVSPVAPPAAGTAMEHGVWRRLLSRAQLEEVERLAGAELRRLGYAGSPGSPGSPG
jgi:hypothetical protein